MVLIHFWRFVMPNKQDLRWINMHRTFNEIRRKLLGILESTCHFPGPTTSQWSIHPVQKVDKIRFCRIQIDCITETATVCVYIKMVNFQRDMGDTMGNMWLMILMKNPAQKGKFMLLWWHCRLGGQVLLPLHRISLVYLEKRRPHP